jgi:hypothetical protein
MSESVMRSVSLMIRVAAVFFIVFAARTVSMRADGNCGEYECSWTVDGVEGCYGEDDQVECGAGGPCTCRCDANGNCKFTPQY